MSSKAQKYILLAGVLFFFTVAGLYFLLGTPKKETAGTVDTVSMSDVLGRDKQTLQREYLGVQWGMPAAENPKLKYIETVKNGTEYLNTAIVDDREYINVDGLIGYGTFRFANEFFKEAVILFATTEKSESAESEFYKMRDRLIVMYGEESKKNTEPHEVFNDYYQWDVGSVTVLLSQTHEEKAKNFLISVKKEQRP